MPGHQSLGTMRTVGDMVHTLQSYNPNLSVHELFQNPTVSALISKFITHFSLLGSLQTK
jgi:hypothetical protein